MKKEKKIRFNAVLLDVWSEREERRPFTITALDVNDALEKMFKEDAVNDDKVDLIYIENEEEINKWNFDYFKDEFMNALTKNFPINKKNSHFVLHKIEIEARKVINIKF